MATFGSQEVWHDALPAQEHSFQTSNYNQVQVSGHRNIVDMCHQLSARDSRRPDKAVHFARDVLKAIFQDRSIDLCSILPSTAYDNPFVAIQELIDSSSHFYNTFFDSSEKFVDELWKAVYDQIQGCNLGTNLTGESVIMYCLAGYVMRLLPTESQSDRPIQRNTVRQRVHTPLDLFLPSSPVLNRIRFESEGNEPDRTAVHPRHLKMFCNLVIIFCSDKEFPSPSRLMVIRHLVKQFHIFCTFETIDSDMLATKSAVMSNPPFSQALYNFLYTFLEQCPSSSSLQDLITIWSTFCRPWRYYPQDIETITGSVFEPFVHTQEKFYRILLGKIMRKLAELEISVDTTKTLRSMLEFTWKEPMYTVLRRLLSLDCRPAARKVLDRMAGVYKAEQLKIYMMEQEKNYEPWYKSLFNIEDRPQLVAARALVTAIEPILKEADAHMHTKYLAERIVAPKFTPLSRSVSVFDETPKRGYLPDHETDPNTGLMYATALGRKQIFEHERSFDFSQCHSYVPQWQSAPREYELAIMVKITRWLASFLNQFGPIQKLGRQYYDEGLLGAVVRLLMDPPCPNPHSEVVSPLFSKTIRRAPPTLRVRILANNAVLVSLVFMFLFFAMGWWFLIPLLLFVFTLLLMWANESSTSISPI